MDFIVRKLESGAVFTRFSPKSRPEKRHFTIKRETRQLVWNVTSTGKDGREDIEACIDFRDIKDVRSGANTKLFERWPDEAKKSNESQCFIVWYGSTFRLKCLSCVGKFVQSVSFGLFV